MIKTRNCKNCNKPNAHLYAVCNECREKDCKHSEFHFDATHDMVCNYCGKILAASAKKFKIGVKPFCAYARTPN
jgi:hypothetical protein